MEEIKPEGSQENVYFTILRCIELGIANKIGSREKEEKPGLAQTDLRLVQNVHPSF